MRVLIVDDEKDIADIVSKFLAQRNIQCEIAYNFEQAGEKIRDNNFDFYFFDIHLPDGSGFDLIPIVEENNKDADIVIISAFDGEEEKEVAELLGVKAFISKPFSRKEILEFFD